MLDIDVDYVDEVFVLRLKFSIDFLFILSFPLNFWSPSPGFPFFLWKPMNAMNDHLEGLLEGPSGLTNTVSHLGPILGRDNIRPRM